MFSLKSYSTMPESLKDTKATLTPCSLIDEPRFSIIPTTKSKIISSLEQPIEPIEGETSITRTRSSPRILQDVVVVEVVMVVRVVDESVVVDV